MAAFSCFTPAHELAERIRNGDLSPVTVTEAFLDRIAERDAEINAYITVLETEAREAAEAAERAIESGAATGPLHGVPVALKDLSPLAGVRHTYGCKAFADNVATADSTVATRLEAAGAIFLGKTNASAFGVRVKTDNELVGPTSTPFDPTRNAGGSSGGSAAAVADGMAPIAQGSDAGGSVRIPSAFCGVFGFKPTFGRIGYESRPNAFEKHTPFSDKGVHARNVRDAALMLDVLAGPDRRDPFSLPDADTEFIEAVDRPIDEARIAYSPDLGLYPVDPEVRSIVTDAAYAFDDVASEVTEVAFELDYTLAELNERLSAPMWTVRTARMVDRLEAQYDRDLRGDDAFPSHLVEMADSGLDYSAVEYKQIDLVRTEIFDAVQDLLDEYDFLVTPTVVVTPFSNDVDGPTEVDGVEIDPFSGWFPTWLINQTGHPAASIPAGFTDENLPVGLQIIGRRMADDDVLAASGSLEQVRPWAEAYPPTPA